MIDHALGMGKTLWDEVYPQTKELKQVRWKNRVDEKIDAKVQARLGPALDAAARKKLAELSLRNMSNPT